MAVRALVRHTYARADAVVAVSHAVKRDLVDAFGVPEARIRTIYNTVDAVETARLAAVEPEPHIARFFDAPTVVTAGSLKRQKGHVHLVRIFAEVKRRAPDARLAFLGEGPLGPSLVALARGLGLATYAAWEPSGVASLEGADVAFLGFSSNPFSLLARARVFAFSSLWEGFGNVIVEALACGIPVVSTDCPSGPREILAPERAEAPPLLSPEYTSTGVLVPRLDAAQASREGALSRAEEHLATVLTEAVSSSALRERYQDAGLRRARDFTLEAIAPEWRRLLLA